MVELLELERFIGSSQRETLTCFHWSPCRWSPGPNAKTFSGLAVAAAYELARKPEFTQANYLSPMIFGTLSQQHGDTASAGFHREIYGDVESSIPGSAVEARFYPPVRFTLSFPAYPPAHFHPVLLSEADVS
ncbi:MAG TPA: hypothetical protein VFR18_20300 [Terriglobia bacterium]|nr:hypothetical protein [Terriglobia bacterium]